MNWCKIRFLSLGLLIILGGCGSDDDTDEETQNIVEVASCTMSISDISLCIEYQKYEATILETVQSTCEDLDSSTWSNSSSCSDEIKLQNSCRVEDGSRVLMTYGVSVSEASCDGTFTAASS